MINVFHPHPNPPPSRGRGINPVFRHINKVLYKNPPRYYFPIKSMFVTGFPGLVNKQAAEN
jgi:hypothetical protein